VKVVGNAGRVAAEAALVVEVARPPRGGGEAIVRSAVNVVNAVAGIGVADAVAPAAAGVARPAAGIAIASR
jgi:hypothetical protein